MTLFMIRRRSLFFFACLTSTVLVSAGVFFVMAYDRMYRYPEKTETHQPIEEKISEQSLPENNSVSESTALPDEVSSSVQDPAVSGEKWWKPRPAQTWQIQLSAYPPDLSISADIFVLDLFETNESIIKKLHLNGKKIVCYFSAGSYEEYRPDARLFPKSVLGKPLDDWDGEWWLDIRNQKTLFPILEKRMDLAIQKGCDGIDPDNVDGFTNKTGFPLRPGDQISFNMFLAKSAHTRGLGIGLKNDLDQTGSLVAEFDWAINEQCQEYDECNLLMPFVQQGKPVVNIEYEGSIEKICRTGKKYGFYSIKKRMSLDVYRKGC